MDRSDRGRRVERLARAYLEARGLTCAASNYRCRRGEIDLVMRDGAQLVFVEVRYRATSRHGGPAASVDAAKRRRLALTAEHYLATRVRGAAPACRFDVVAVTGALERPEVRWLRAAFDLER